MGNFREELKRALEKQSKPMSVTSEVKKGNRELKLMDIQHYFVHTGDGVDIIMSVDVSPF